MTLEQLVISAFITMFSLGLFIISLASYRRYKNVKLLVVSLVFLVFLVKGILLSLGLFSEDILRIVSSATAGGLVDVLILGLLFIATLKR
ncbi:MAG: hypothetical protein NT038_08360 [Euryarchaeota archaeon]|nr:hypothetical protein [Euryarchaeota archaeon]